MAEQDYPHADLLVSTSWIADHARDPGVVLVDCGTPDAYGRAHIPGAVGLPVIPQIKDPSDNVYVMHPSQFSELMQQLGIGDATLVVAYDSNNSLWAARLWWALRYFGHHNAKLLNGGWHSWISESRPVTMQPAKPAPAAFTATPDPRVLCTIEQLTERTGTSGVLDVRSAEEYRGTSSRGNKRVGHVPGAGHIEWLDFMTADERRVFKPAEAMRAMLSGAGIAPEQEVITYCQAGIRAAHVFFVLTLLGYDNVRNYDGSMREWANRDETPLTLAG